MLPANWVGGWVAWWVGASIFLSVYYEWSKEKCSEGTLTAPYPPHNGRASQRGKNPRPKSIVSEFFVRFWRIVGEEYFNTFQDSIVVGNSCKGVTKEVITLIFKTGDKR
jgi:hypothetical protein